MVHTDMKSRFYDLLAPFAEAHGAAWGIAETGYTPAASADYPAWVSDSYDQMVASGGAVHVVLELDERRDVRARHRRGAPVLPRHAAALAEAAEITLSG